MKTLYKSLPKNMSPHGHRFEVGKWYKIDEPIKICSVGFHASKRAIDAMRYVDCEVLARVSVRGKSDKEDDKECWSEMKIEEIYEWKKEDSVALSIFAAELCINNFEKKFPDDKRPREAIEAAKAWLECPCEKHQSAAWSAESAAWSAARSAARSARSARSAWSAAWSAWSAAWSAARSAAWSAAWSAESAAWSADKVLDKCNAFVLKRSGL